MRRQRGQAAGPAPLPPSRAGGRAGQEDGRWRGGLSPATRAPADPRPGVLPPPPPSPARRLPGPGLPQCPLRPAPSTLPGRPAPPPGDPRPGRTPPPPSSQARSGPQESLSAARDGSLTRVLSAAGGALQSRQAAAAAAAGVGGQSARRWRDPRLPPTPRWRPRRLLLRPAQSGTFKIPARGTGPGPPSRRPAATPSPSAAARDPEPVPPRPSPRPRIRPSAAPASEAQGRGSGAGPAGGAGPSDRACASRARRGARGAGRWAGRRAGRGRSLARGGEGRAAGAGGGAERRWSGKKPRGWRGWNVNTAGGAGSGPGRVEPGGCEGTLHEKRRPPFRRARCPARHALPAPGTPGSGP